MTVTCSPQLSALARIIAVLHARRADVGTLHYVLDQQQAELTIDVEAGDIDRLAAQVRRLVDVTAVHVALPARAAVAS